MNVFFVFKTKLQIEFGILFISNGKGEMKMKKVLSLLTVFSLMLSIGVGFQNTSVKAASVPSISYQAHVQSIGWKGKVSNGATAGTIGRSLRLEGLKINLKASKKSMISYRAHVANIGWQGWKSSGSMAGTTGKSLAIEAVQIKLLGNYARKYDIYYRVHSQSFGWLGWAKNGGVAGTCSLAKRAEAIQIKLVKKNAKFNCGGKSYYTKPSISYNAHCQSKGWMAIKSEGQTAGTTGQGLRLEALRIYLSDFSSKNGVDYRAHVSNIGWQKWTCRGMEAGTTGRGLSIEAIQIKPSASLSPYIDIYYRMHVKNFGWLGWAKNGETAGTTGGSNRAEAIQIKVVHKGAAFARGGQAFIDLAKKERAMSWVKSKVGHAIDDDGVYGAQCVDLIRAYYRQLGVSPRSGNGADYSWNSLPSGWKRVKGGTPQRGDILVYGPSASNGYGHVAIYESDYVTYHQNVGGQYVRKITSTRYNGFSNPYWGYIRPNW